MTAPSYICDCKLCGKIDVLVKSHVIPNWAYKAIYNSSHRILRVESHAKKQVRFPRSGEWDRIVCCDCEKFFRELDEYARAVIFSKPGDVTFGIKTQSAEYGVNILNVDYVRMKLFQLSVLWRAAITTRPFFEEISLGEHNRNIHQMLLARAPGDSIEYACVMAAVCHAPQQMLTDLIIRPFMFVKQKWTGVRFFFAGCLWDYVIHDDAHDHPLRSLFLSPGAPLPLIISPLSEVPSLRKDIDWLQRQLRNSNFPLEQHIR